MITDNMKSYDYEPLPTQNSATPMQQQNLNSATPMKQDSSTAAPALKRKWWVPECVQKAIHKWFFESSE